MPNVKEIEKRDAHHGEKMIEVKVRFWTKDLVEGKDQIRPKHAWAQGVIRIDYNKPHGIKSKAPVPFNSLMEIPEKIEKVLIEHGIQLHLPNRMKKYISHDS
jgi:hypothetical protein